MVEQRSAETHDTTWTRTADRLPPAGVWVAVYGPHRVVQEFGATFVRSDEHARYIGATCTHWMPLRLPEADDEPTDRGVHGPHCDCGECPERAPWK